MKPSRIGVLQELLRGAIETEPHHADVRLLLCRIIVLVCAIPETEASWVSYERAMIPEGEIDSGGNQPDDECSAADDVDVVAGFTTMGTSHLVPGFPVRKFLLKQPQRFQERGSVALVLGPRRNRDQPGAIDDVDRRDDSAAGRK